MAKASRVERKEEIVCLALSPEEAQALYDVLRLIGGDPSTTRRGLLKEVHDTLINVVEYDRWEERAGDLTGSVYFEPTT